MATVDVFFAGGNRRSRTIADAAYKGLRAVGDKPRILDSTLYNGVRSDYAVFYGLACGLDKIFEDYKANATAIYVDLGYWRRRISSRYDGYHKMSINSRHPTAYFQNHKHDPQRFKDLRLSVKPWKETGEVILIAGMSQKAARAEGLNHQAWERAALASIQAKSKRLVIYRPKPNCMRSYPLQGARFDKKTPLAAMFSNCHALVTRQSNTAVDALLAGIPVFCELGPASVMGQSDLSKIESPIYPEDRQRFVEDIAWCQFKTAEIAAGLPFRHFKEEGLIP